MPKCHSDTPSSRWDRHMTQISFKRVSKSNMSIIVGMIAKSNINSNSEALQAISPVINSSVTVCASNFKRVHRNAKLEVYEFDTRTKYTGCCRRHHMPLFKTIIIHFHSLKRKVPLHLRHLIFLEYVFGEVSLTKELRRYNCSWWKIKINSNKFLSLYPRQLYI